MRKTRHILVALRLAYSSNREFLSGIARYRRRNPQWHVTVADGFTDFSPAMIEDIASSGYDGIITIRPHTAKAETALTRSTLPLVVLGSEAGDLSGRTQNVAFIRGDDLGIGKCAARHFLSLGAFSSFAVIGLSQDVSWSKIRTKGFCDELRQHGHTVFTLKPDHPEGSSDDRRSLSNFLATLPKPAAVFATYDNRAINVLETCEAVHLKIPKDIQVIGVDDDTVLCDFSTPTLTSISPGQQRKGELAAEKLERMIHKPLSVPSVVIHSEMKIVERETTAPVSSAKHLVERALRHIAANACSGIRARDVVAHLGVSRALIDRRMRECRDTSLAAEINRVRLDEIKRKLTGTKLSVSAICSSCGFSTPQYAMRLFKRTTGMTAAAWRKRNVR